MLHLDVRSNLLDAGTYLTGIEKRQLPFATAVALTKTIQTAQRVVRGRLAAQYILRTSWTEKGIRIVPATKTHLEASLYSKDWYMAEHEVGASRTPKKAAELWVPTRAAVLPRLAGMNQ